MALTAVAGAWWPVPSVMARARDRAHRHDGFASKTPGGSPGGTE
jgi:hypothetical protein